MITLTRQQISRIVGNDQVAVRAFEEFFRAINATMPEADTGNSLEGGAALAQANEATVTAFLASDIAMLAALSPMVCPPDAGLSTEPAFASVAGGLSVDPAAVMFADITLADVAPATGALIGD